IARLWSTKRDGSSCAAAPMSLFTLNGEDHVRPPSMDLEKKTSDWVAEPPQPPYARYSTPSPSIAIEGWYAVYAGGAFTITFGLNHGGVVTAAGTGTASARSPATAKATTRLATSVRDAKVTRCVGLRDITPRLRLESPRSPRFT